MAVYNPNDPSTWGPIVGKDANGNPIYANQPQNAPPVIAGPTTTGGKSGPMPVNSNPPPVTVTPDTAAGTGVGYKPDGTVSDAPQTAGSFGPFSTDKDIGGNIDSGLSYVTPDKLEGLIFGDKGDGGAAQTQLAKDVTAQSTSNAQTLYNEALRQKAAADAIRAPSTIVSPAVVSQQLDAGKYNVNTDTSADSEDATARMRAYQAALATAGDATNAIQRGGTVDVKETAGAYVPGVNTMIAAPTVGEAAQTGKTTVGSTTLDPLANQLRGEQIAAAKGIASAPSAAMSQFKAGLSQVTADQLATAERARGGERAGARRDAMIAIGAGGAQQNLAASALSAQEEQAKRVAASAALSGVRTSDVATSTTQASIDSQRASLQAQIDAATAQGNTAAVNALQTKQAELTLSARQAEVQGSLAQQGQIAELNKANMEAEQQRNVLNATAKNQAERDYQAALAAAATQKAAADTTVSVTNAGATTAASKDYASAVNASAEAAAARATETARANALLAQQQAQANATRAAAVDTTNAGNALTAGTTSASNALTAQATNASNQLATNQLQQQGGTAAINAGTGAVGVQSSNAGNIIDANKSGVASEDAKEASKIAAAGAVIGKVASDERVKRDIAPVGGASGSYEDAFIGHGEDSTPDKEAARDEVENLSPDQIQDWAEALQPIVYRYKQGYGDGSGDPEIGLSANKVERSGPLGQLMVGRDEGGTRVLDYKAATLMLSKAAFDRANEALMMASRGARR